jgi:hypothetical protein
MPPCNITVEGAACTPAAQALGPACRMALCLCGCRWTEAVCCGLFMRARQCLLRCLPKQLCSHLQLAPPRLSTCACLLARLRRRGVHTLCQSVCHIGVSAHCIVRPAQAALLPGAVLCYWSTLRLRLCHGVKAVLCVHAALWAVGVGPDEKLGPHQNGCLLRARFGKCLACGAVRLWL